MSSWKVVLPYAVAVIAVAAYLATNASPVQLVRQITVAEIVGYTISGSAIVALFLGAHQAKLQAEAQRAQLVLRIRDMMFDDADERRFVYQLDYRQFRFDPAKFPGSEDERHLDSLLYKLVHIGFLLRRGLLRVEDLAPVRAIVGCIMNNPGVGQYLVWLKEEQFPDHVSFKDAVYLVEHTHGRATRAWPVLARYLGEAKPA